MTAKIEGVSAAILGLILEPKHRTAIEPYCPNGVLWIRVRTEGPKTIKQEVWNPEAFEADGSPKEWRPYPTGLPQAVAAILPIAASDNATAFQNVNLTTNNVLAESLNYTNDPSQFVASGPGSAAYGASTFSSSYATLKWK